MVALPTTCESRVAAPRAWPAATPAIGCVQTSATSSIAAYATTAGTGSPWARTCTWPRHGPTAGGPVQAGRVPAISRTSRDSRGPTVTVLVTGEMSST